MRNLKKFLAVVVAIAVMLTAMVPAFAAETTATKTDAQICADLGILTGSGNGVTDEYLAGKVDRMQAARLFLRLKGLEADALAFTGTDNFKDAGATTADGKKIMAYLKANPDLGFGGYTSGNFGPNDQVNAQQYYKVLLTALGYKQDVDFTYAETLTFAANKGLTKVATETDFDRADFATASVEALKATVKGTEKTLVATLVETKKIDEAKAVAEGLIVVSVDVTATAKAAGAKKLTVEFNQAIDDTKATFTVKKGSIAVNVATKTTAADKKSVTLELATKLTAGDYTVSVAGLTTTALALDVKGILDEKVGKIEFTSDKAVIDGVYTPASTRVYTSYKIYNQYDEDVTNDRTGEVTFTVGKGTAVASNGTLTITSAVTFAKDEKLAVSALHASTGIFKSAVLTVVDKAQVSEISIEKLFNTDSKTLTAGDNASAWSLVIKAKDQYGNDITSAAQVTSDVVVSVSDTAKVDVNRVSGTATFTSDVDVAKDGSANDLVLKLSGTAAAGTSTITIISKTTGKMAKFDVVVKETAKVDTLTLSTPEGTLAAGDSEIVIPFTAVDQFGNAMTKAADIKSGMTSALTTSDSNATIDFVQDYVKNTAKLVLNASAVTDAKTIVITGITKTGKLVQFSVALSAKREAKVISGLKDITTTDLAKDATLTINDENVVVKDQYSADITPTLGSASGYKYVFSTSDAAKVDLTATEITSTTGSVTLKAYAKGSATITVTLKIYDADTDSFKDVANSSFTFSSKVVEKADIASYELAAFSKVYQDSASSRNTDLKVNGILADGSKVVVPASYYNVVENDDYVSYVAGKVYSIPGYAWGDATTRDVAIIVTVLGENAPVVLTQNVTVLKATPAIEKIELIDGTNGVAKFEAAGVISAVYTNVNSVAEVEALVVDAVKTIDQYGAEYTDATTDYAAVYKSNITDGKDITAIAAGDTFNVTAVTKNGKTITFKVVTKA